MKKKALFLIMVAALALAACGGKAQAPAVEAPAAEPAQSDQITLGSEPANEPAAQPEQPAAEPQPAVEQEPASASSGGAYTAPEGVFSLEIPAGWSLEKDTTSIDKAVVETFTAPDGNAFVQVMVNDAGMDVSAVEKGQYTLDYMRRLNGEDLRVAKDVLLKDGREQLEWWSDDNGTSGTVYFDKKDEFLFYVNLFYKDSDEATYLPILKDVAESYETD